MHLNLDQSQTVPLDDYELSKPLSVSTLPNGTYPTLSPLVQLHIKRLWITGSCATDDDIVSSIRRVDSRVKNDQVLRFLEDHTSKESWIDAREKFLQGQYDRYLIDAEKLSERIDEVYDQDFEKIRILCEQQIEHFAVISLQGIIPPKLFSLRSITDILAKAYLMQRLARGMSQENTTHRLISDESESFKDSLKSLRTFLEVKTIDAKVLTSL